MAIAWVATGSATNSGTASSANISVSVPVGGYDIGDLIVVWAINGEASAGTPTCEDLQGNVYLLIVNEAQSNLRLTMFFAVLTVAVAAAETITVTFPTANARRAIRVEQFTGAAKVQTLDVYANNHGTSVTPSSGFTILSTRKNSLVIGGVAHIEQTAGAFTEDADGYTDLGETQVGTTLIKTIQPFYKIVAEEDLFRMRGTLASSVLWTAGVAVLKSNIERMTSSFSVETTLTPVLNSSQPDIGASRVAVLDRLVYQATDADTVLILDFPVPIGDHIIVTGHYRFHALNYSIDDSKGNAWQKDLDVSPLGGTSPRLVVFSSRITIAMVAGDVITVTTGSALSTSRTLIAEQWRGLLSSSWLDKAVSGSNASSMAPETPLATTLDAQELLFGVLAVQGAQGLVITPANAFVESAHQGASSRNLQTQFKLVSSVGSYRSQWVIGSSEMWVAGMVTYRAAVASVPTKNLSTSVGAVISMNVAVKATKTFAASISANTLQTVKSQRIVPIEAVSLSVETLLGAVLSTTTSEGLAASFSVETLLSAMLNSQKTFKASMLANVNIGAALQVSPGVGTEFVTGRWTVVGHELTAFSAPAIIGVPTAHMRMRGRNITSVFEQVTVFEVASMRMRGRQPVSGVATPLGTGHLVMAGHAAKSGIWSPDPDELEPIWIPEE